MLDGRVLVAQTLIQDLLHSFHAVWDRLIVDKLMADRVRLVTVAAFDKLSKEVPLAELLQELQKLSKSQTIQKIQTLKRLPILIFNFKG